MVSITCLFRGRGRDVIAKPYISFKIAASVSRDRHMWTEVNLTSSLDETFADIRRTLKHASSFRRVKLTIRIRRFLPTPTMSVGVGRIFHSVCLSVCLFVRSITQKREWSWDTLEVILFWSSKVKGQGYKVSKCIFHTYVRSITQKWMIPKCSNLIYVKA